MFGKAKAQKEKVRQFVTITGCSESVATTMLKNCSWNLDAAADSFFNNNSASSLAAPTTQRRSDFSLLRLQQVFDSYKDETENMILVEGTERFCADLRVQPDDVVMLVVATHLQARMCEFNQAGFLEGWKELRCDTIEKMRNMLPTLRQELDDPARFKKVYEYTFVFALTQGQRSLPLEVAIPLWQLLLSNRFSHFDLWVEFLQEKHGKAIPKDTWNMLLEFINTVDDEMTNYSFDDAWPPLIDEFVVYYRERQG